MWIGPLQDPAFARRVLDGIEGQKDCYATWPRMHGMLTLAESVSHPATSPLST